MNNQPITVVPTKTTAANATNKRGVITARNKTSSGTYTPTAESKNASAVPSGTPLATNASSNGIVALALT